MTIADIGTSVSQISRDSMNLISGPWYNIQLRTGREPSRWQTVRVCNARLRDILNPCSVGPHRSLARVHTFVRGTETLDMMIGEQLDWFLSDFSRIRNGSEVLALAAWDD